MVEELIISLCETYYAAGIGAATAADLAYNKKVGATCKKTGAKILALRSFNQRKKAFDLTRFFCPECNEFHEAPQVRRSDYGNLQEGN